MLIFLFLGLSIAIPTVDIFMESLCPDTTEFINNSLINLAFDDIDQLIKVRLIPYGKEGTQKYLNTILSCQHGKIECYGNMIQSCAFEYIESTKDKILFLSCFQSSDRYETSENYFNSQLNQCLENDQLKQIIRRCVNGPEGIEIQNKMKHLTPKSLKYVPSFRVDNDLKQDIQTSIKSNILQWACEETKSNLKECG